MTESYPSDGGLTAMGDTTLDGGVPVPQIGADPYYVPAHKALWRLDRWGRVAGGLEVYKDGALTFGVRAGRYYNGATAVNYAGASAQALTDDDTNYAYLTAAGTLTVNITGFPAATVPHIPLATIVCASGAYDADTGVTDYRGRGIFGPTLGIAAGDLQDLVPNLNITAAAEAADERVITIQARDGADNSLAQRVMIRVWVATTDYGAPSATDNAVAIDTGTILQTITAHAYYELISDAAGKVEVGVTISGAASRYVLAEIDGRIYSSGEVTWAA